MAKATVTPESKASTPAKAKSKVSSTSLIEKACTEALAKLKSLGIEQQLQSEIEWCLGSYQFDGNPEGLYSMAERAIVVFNKEKEKKTKGVTAKLITDLEKAISTR